MRPSPRRKKPRHGRWPRQVHPQFSAFRLARTRADRQIRLAISFSAKAPQPSAPGLPPALPQTPRRFLLPVSPQETPPRPETGAPVPPASRPSPLPAARRSARPPAYFQTPARERSSPVAGKSPPPSRSLFSGPARRFRSPPASRRSAPLRASPFHTPGASVSVRSPSG